MSQPDRRSNRVPGSRVGGPNRVREHRESLYLTPEELAERAGISCRTLWSVENGHACRLVTRRAILKALGVPRREAWRVFPADAPVRSELSASAGAPRA